MRDGSHADIEYCVWVLVCSLASCTFDSGLCGWRNVREDGTDWKEETSNLTTWGSNSTAGQYCHCSFCLTSRAWRRFSMLRA